MSKHTAESDTQNYRRRFSQEPTVMITPLRLLLYSTMGFAIGGVVASATTVCELRTRTQGSEPQLIKVDGIVLLHMHGLFLRGDNCPDAVVLTYPEHAPKSLATFTFDETNDARLSEILRTYDPRSERVRLTVIGRFVELEEPTLVLKSIQRIDVEGLSRGEPLNSSEISWILDVRQRLLWSDLRSTLSGPEGKNYFENSMKNSWMPANVYALKRFRGVVVSRHDQSLPPVILVGLRDQTVVDAELRIIDSAAIRNLRPGAKIAFEGEAVDYLREPFKVIFDKVRITDPDDR